MLSGSLDVPIVSAKIAAGVYGGPAGSQPYGIATAAGSSADDEDNGLANDFWVPSITNVAAVLAAPAGAAPPTPAAIELGPFVYRTYSVIQQDCATCGVSGGVLTWYDRKVVRYDALASAAGFSNRSFGGPWDTTYVTVPNSNYRGLEALLSTATGGQIGSFETLAVPLLGLQGVAQLTAPSALDQGLRFLTFPLMMGALLQAAVQMYSLANIGPLLPEFISGTQRASDSFFSLQIGGTSNSGMGVNVPTALFAPTTPAALAISPLTPAGWALTSLALADCPAAAAGKPGAGAACANYSSALYAAGNYAALGAAGPAQLQLDVGAILAYYGALLSVSTPPSAVQTASQGFAYAALDALEGQVTGCTTNCEINSWADAIWLQMANNGVTGLLVAAGVLQTAGGLPAAQAIFPAVASTGPANLCDATAVTGSPFLSLVDSLPVPGGATPEFSCWNARNNPFSFGSKVSGATLKAVFGSTTDPAASSNPSTSVATSLRGGPKLTILGVQVPGTEGITNTLTFLAGVNGISAAIQAELAGGPAGPFHAEVGVFQAFSALKAAPAAGKAAAVTAYAAAVAAADAVAGHAAPCAPQLGNLLRLPLRCSELVDLAGFVNHIAKNAVFDPVFAKVGPRKFSAATGAFIPLTDPYFATLNLFNEAASLRAGPFLRCTLREYLEVGCHDNLFDYAYSLLSPGGVPGDPSNRMAPIGPSSFEGNARDAAWTAYKATNQPNQRLTGASDIAQVDVIAAYSVNNAQVTSITAFGGPAGSSATTNPVTGSYSGTAFSPSLKIAAAGPQSQDYSAATPSISVWVFQGLRACTLAFSAQVADPSGAGVKLWRYMLNVGGSAEPSAAQWAAAIPRMKTDTPTTTPSCSANIAALASGVSVFLAPPYFAGCAQTGLNGAPVPQYALSGPAATRSVTDPVAGTITFVDVEPITGRAMNAHKRLGAHMRWGGATAWFNLKTTYGLLYWIDQHNAVTLKTANRFLDVLAQVKMATANGTGALVAIGVILGLIGGVSIVLGCRMPRDAQQQQQQQQQMDISKGATEVVSVNAMNSGVVFRTTSAAGGAGESVV